MYLLKQHIPHLESINQHLSGNIEVTYIDGHILNFTPNKEYKGFTYTMHDGIKTYSKFDDLPSIVHERVEYIPLLTKILSNTNTSNFKLPNDNNVKCIR